MCYTNKIPLSYMYTNLNFIHEHISVIRVLIAAIMSFSFLWKMKTVNQSFYAFCKAKWIETFTFSASDRKSLAKAEGGWGYRHTVLCYWFFSAYLSISINLESSFFHFKCLRRDKPQRHKYFLKNSSSYTLPGRTLVSLIVADQGPFIGNESQQLKANYHVP